jgi:hypothetical protein
MHPPALFSALFYQSTAVTQKLLEHSSHALPNSKSHANAPKHKSAMSTHNCQFGNCGFIGELSIQPSLYIPISNDTSLLFDFINYWVNNDIRINFWTTAPKVQKMYLFLFVSCSVKCLIKVMSFLPTLQHLCINLTDTIFTTGFFNSE